MEGETEGRVGRKKVVQITEGKGIRLRLGLFGDVWELSERRGGGN